MNAHKIAIVYDWMDKWGGVERLLLTLHEMYPKANFYTSFYNPKNARWAKDLVIRTSFMQRLPDFIKNNRILSLPFFPIAFRTFDFSNYDVVISVTSSFAKGIDTNPPTKHICILLTPTRFLWSHPKDYLHSSVVYYFEVLIMQLLRMWDLRIAKQPDKIIAISHHVAKRIRKYYGRRVSSVIYPPFDTRYWSQFISTNKNKSKGYYLIVSRLEKYKKIDLAIKVFNKLGIPLIIIGKGSQETYLKKIANQNIVFKKNLTDRQLALYYSQADALIMAQDEDFGYTALEAQYMGCPIITYRTSGACETIVQNRTGYIFNAQTEQSLASSIERFEAVKYNVKSLVNKIGRKHIINRFEKNSFKKQITKLISRI